MHMRYVGQFLYPWFRVLFWILAPWPSSEKMAESSVMKNEKWLKTTNYQQIENDLLFFQKTFSSLVKIFEFI